MIIITRKEDCCGCGACYDACAKQAIVWETDEEGFSYPRVDLDKCVNCGLCNKVCPIENSEALNSRNKESNPLVLAAYHKDENIRIMSTSGGAFWGLAESWVKEGGYVAGAIFYEHFKIRHVVTNDPEELQKIKGSKYAQSDCRGMYREIARLLKSGEKVMATGVPCQMAALRQYLRKDYDNLLVVDLICHSVTSQLPFQIYIKELEKEYHSEMVSFHPKSKEDGGWHHFAFKATFANGKTYLKHAGEDNFCRLSYGTNLLARYSCYECHYKHFPQPSDITIGDFWGIENIDSSWDSPHGLSKIILNTEKGIRYMEALSSMVTKPYDVESSVFNNPRSRSMLKSVPRCDMDKRIAFVRDLNKKGLNYSMHKHVYKTNSIIRRIINKIKNVARFNK